MSARGTIDGLPESVRAWLEAELVRTGFAGYSDLTEALQAKLAEAGLELRVSRSALHRFGKTIEERIEAIRKSTAIAKTIAREIGDDEGAMNDALMRLIQDKLFMLSMNLESFEPKDLAKIGHVVADLSRASVTQKKWQTLVRERAAQAAEGVEKDQQALGLTDEAVAEIKRRLLGIAA